MLDDLYAGAVADAAARRESLPFAAVEAAAGELGCVGVVADQADPEAPARLVEAALTAYGRLDGALVSVGGPPPGTTLGLTDAQWVLSFESVFLGTLRLCRAVVEALPADAQPYEALPALSRLEARRASSSRPVPPRSPSATTARGRRP